MYRTFVKSVLLCSAVLVCPKGYSGTVSIKVQENSEQSNELIKRSSIRLEATRFLSEDSAAKRLDYYRDLVATGLSDSGEIDRIDTNSPLISLIDFNQNRRQTETSVTRQIPSIKAYEAIMGLALRQFNRESNRSVEQRFTSYDRYLRFLDPQAKHKIDLITDCIVLEASSDSLPAFIKGYIEKNYQETTHTANLDYEKNTRLVEHEELDDDIFEELILTDSRYLGLNLISKRYCDPHWVRNVTDFTAFDWAEQLAAQGWIDAELLESDFYNPFSKDIRDQCHIYFIESFVNQIDKIFSDFFQIDSQSVRRNPFAQSLYVASTISNTTELSDEDLTQKLAQVLKNSVFLPEMTRVPSASDLNLEGFHTDGQILQGEYLLAKLLSPPAHESPFWAALFAMQDEHLELAESVYNALKTHFVKGCEDVVDYRCVRKNLTGFSRLFDSISIELPNQAPMTGVGMMIERQSESE
ncbi:MAG: hypothetical protein HRU19_01215 [Pseudobacteriovorax sp.]|nr:hypothetical protein [Pseudobacteriovorax sp.]